MSDKNPICLSCIRWVKDLCTKEQLPPLEDQTCRYYVEREKYLKQTTPAPPKEFVTEPKADLKDIEIGRLMAEIDRLKKLLPPDPVGELLTRLLPKLKLALEKGTLTSYRESGENVAILDSFNCKKLKDSGVLTQQDRVLTYTKKMWWFTAEFEAKIKQRLAETQVE